MEPHFEFINEIDTEFLKAKKQGLSRLNIKWGKWSRKLNLRIREKIESDDPKASLLFKYVFMYWVNRSQLLELYHYGRLGSLFAIKKLQIEGVEIRKQLTSKNLSNKTLASTSFQDMIKEALAQRQKKAGNAPALSGVPRPGAATTRAFKKDEKNKKSS
jgi:hypothetical protein